eukprot:3593980-Alexandrium_andersonii.AAC.1
MGRLSPDGWAPPTCGFATRPKNATRTAQMQNCFGRSELEQRGSRNGLKIDPRSSRGVRSVPLE